VAIRGRGGSCENAGERDLSAKNRVFALIAVSHSPSAPGNIHGRTPQPWSHAAPPARRGRVKLPYQHRAASAATAIAVLRMGKTSS